MEARLSNRFNQALHTAITMQSGLIQTMAITSGLEMTADSMSLTTREQHGNSSTQYRPHSSTRSRLTCESRITFTADCKTMARGVAQAKRVVFRLELRMLIGIG